MDDLTQAMPRPGAKEPPPLWWTNPPPWLQAFLKKARLERPLDSDAEGERPLVLIEVTTTLDDAISRINSLEFPFIWCGVLKDDKTGAPVIVLQRADVLAQQLLNGLGVKP